MPTNRLAYTKTPVSQPASGGVAYKSTPSNYGNATSKVINLTNNTWLSDSVVFTVDSAWRYVVHVRNAHNGASSIHIDDVRVYGMNTATYLACDTASGGYRFGFNSMPKDDELYSSEGSAYDFGARIYDSRLGRFLSGDPLEKEYPGQSTYAAFNNNPLYYIDPTGKGGVPSIKTNSKGDYYVEIQSSSYLYTDDANVDIKAYSKKYKENIECHLNPNGTYIDDLNHLPTVKIIVPKGMVLNGKKPGSVTRLPVIQKVNVIALEGGPAEAVTIAHGNTNLANNFYYIYNGPKEGEIGLNYNSARGGNSGYLNQNAADVVPAHEDIHTKAAVYSDGKWGSHSGLKDSYMYNNEGENPEGLPRYNSSGILLQDDLDKFNSGQPLRNNTPFGLPSGNAIYDSNGYKFDKPISGKEVIK